MALFAPLPNVIAGQVGEELASGLVDIYTDLEADLTARIAERLRKGLTDYPELRTQLATVADLRREAVRLLANLDTGTLAADVVRVASTEGIAAAAARLNLAAHVPRPTGLTGMSPAAVNAITALTLDLQNSLDDMGLRIVRGVGDDYQRIIAQMAPNLLVGAATWQQTQQRAVATFLSRGLTGFRDSAKRNWTIGSYAEMATRTVTARAWNGAAIATMQASGVNLVTPIIGRGACERCSAWAGKVLSTDGTPAGSWEQMDAVTGRQVRVRVHATLEHAISQGLHHPNCGCVDVAYMPGLSMPEGQTTFDPQLNADRAQLRALERRKRALKRQALGAGDDLTRQRLKRDIRDADEAIREHVDRTGLNRQRYREQLSFADGKPTLLKGGGLPPQRPRKPTMPDPAATIPQPGAVARDRIATATSPLEVQNALTDSHGPKGIQFSGLDATRLDLDRVKAWGDTVNDLLERFPRTWVKSVSVEPVKNANHYAYATWRVHDTLTNGVPGRVYSNPRMVTALGKMRKGSKGEDTFRRDAASGWHHGIPDDVPAMRYIVTHEWGHLIDRTLRQGGVRMRDEVNTIITRLLNAQGITKTVSREAAAWRTANISRYGKTNMDEMIAEAFADAELNGDRAKPLSIALRDRMLELMRGLPDDAI
jgi:hypothetical protein